MFVLTSWHSIENLFGHFAKKQIVSLVVVLHEQARNYQSQEDSSSGNNNKINKKYIGTSEKFMRSTKFKLLIRWGSWISTPKFVPTHQCVVRVIRGFKLWGLILLTPWVSLPNRIGSSSNCCQNISLKNTNFNLMGKKSVEFIPWGPYVQLKA